MNTARDSTAHDSSHESLQESIETPGREASRTAAGAFPSSRATLLILIVVIVLLLREAGGF